MHRVVVVDDEEPNLQLYTALVERVLGGEAHAFANPVDGVRAVADSDPSLIVVDYQMPEMDGLEFITRVRALPGRASTPIIMLTGANEGHIRDEALRRGANVFLTKPFATVEFIRHVRRLAAWQERPNHGTIGGTTENDRDSIVRLHRAMEARDPRVSRQMRRARDISIEIARDLGLPPTTVENLRWSALVYDIGMLAVPENVTSIASSLSPLSRSLVNNHTEVGASILSGSDSPLMKAAETIARHHHERYDGKGYPAGLAAEDIPAMARIVAVSDTFAAVTSPRPHRAGLGFDEGFEEIRRGAGSQFDPIVVAAFERIKDRLGESQRSA